MENFEIVQSFESPDSLDEHFPNDFLLQKSATLLVFTNFLKHVTVVRILHHNTIHILDWLERQRMIYQREEEGSSKKAYLY